MVYYKHVATFVLWPAGLRHCVPWYSKRNMPPSSALKMEMVCSPNRWFPPTRLHSVIIKQTTLGIITVMKPSEVKCAKIFTALRTCRPGYFQCHNNRCVPSNQTCNQVNDCGDFSDEVNCSCSSDDHFRCTSGQCILASFRCDSDPDCPDASDEMHCESE